MAEFRQAWRSLRRNPSFTIVAIVAFALGIGANAAIFGVVQTVLLAELPYRDAERLYALGEPSAVPGSRNLGYLTLLDFREKVRSFEAASAYRMRTRALWDGQRAVQLWSIEGSGDFLATLGVRPALGRGWKVDEDRPGAPRVAVITDEFWRRQYARDPRILGRIMILNEQPYEIIGVLPVAFHSRFASRRDPADVLTPLRYDATMRDSCRDCRHLRGMARLRSGVEPETAARELASVYRELQASYPESYPADQPAIFEALSEVVRGRIRRPLWLLMAAAALVLLIACSNVANLLLMRFRDREREMAVRAALGANRADLARWCLTESAMLAAGGLLGGLMLAVWGTPLLLRLAPVEIRSWGDVDWSPPLLLASFGIAALAALAAGLAPVMGMLRRMPGFGLRSGASRGSSEGPASSRSRLVLVACQLALSFVLLSATGLLLKSFERVLTVDPGFNASSLLTLSLNSVGSRYPTEADDLRFFREVLAEVRRQPGIAAAAMVSVLPVSNNFDQAALRIEGRAYARPSDVPSADRYIVSPGYFELMRIPLRRGRYLDNRDGENTAPAAVISESAARQFFGGSDPIGQRILALTNRRAATIVGVVGDVRQHGLEAKPAPQFYLSFSQRPTGFMTLLARGPAGPEAMVPAIRQAVDRVDPTRTFADTQMLQDWIDASTSSRRFLLWMTGVYGVLALVLTLVGVYGSISFEVTRRWREIGIRVALGARAQHVLTLVYGRVGRTAAIGFAAGAALLALARPLVESHLFEVSMSDPAVLGGSVILLALAVALACWQPAWRALRADPAVSLRAE